MQNSKIMISVLAIIDSAEEIEALRIRELTHILSTYYSSYEIVLVNNTNDQQLVHKLRELTGQYKNTRALTLSGRTAIDVAILNGLEFCTGDQMVFINQYAVESYNKLPELLAKAANRREIFEVKVTGLAMSWKTKCKLFSFKAANLLLTQKIPILNSAFYILTREIGNRATQLLSMQQSFFELYSSHPVSQINFNLPNSNNYSSQSYWHFADMIHKPQYLIPLLLKGTVATGLVLVILLAIMLKIEIHPLHSVVLIIFLASFLSIAWVEKKISKNKLFNKSDTSVYVIEEFGYVKPYIGKIVERH